MVPCYGALSGVFGDIRHHPSLHPLDVFGNAPPQVVTARMSLDISNQPLGTKVHQERPMVSLVESLEMLLATWNLGDEQDLRTR